MNRSFSETWDYIWNLKVNHEIFLNIEEVYDRWDRCHFEKIDENLKRLPSGARFLEAGCGLGQWCFYASPKYNF